MYFNTITNNFLKNVVSNVIQVSQYFTLLLDDFNTKHMQIKTRENKHKWNNFYLILTSVVGSNEYKRDLVKHHMSTCALLQTSFLYFVLKLESS